VKIVISETPPYFIDLDALTLSAYELIVGGMKFWRVWCCHCDRWHDHGAGNGHRIAHCIEQTRLLDHRLQAGARGTAGRVIPAIS
jgi:hypothetical protein